MTFTIIIPTFNRKHLLPRAIRSVYATGWPGVEIIVVDDSSTDGTCEAVAREFSEVRCLRLEQNSGPGAARNRGIREATRDWAVLLDDDDSLRTDSLATIAQCIEQSQEAASYPCLQFAHTNGSLDGPFRVVRLADYLAQRIGGDFLPVINVDLFLKENLRYPDSRIGGEHILWYQIAQKHGIPSWKRCVADLGAGPRDRLCSAANQLARAGEYADLAETSLALFGSEMLAAAPRQYLKLAIGAATYRLLAGDRATAARGAWKLAAGPRLLTMAFVAAAIPWPVSVLRRWFRMYRAMAGSCAF